MEEIPQPSPTPHSEGDRVRVYLDPDDPDASHHDTVCVVAEVHVDDLDGETGRELDAYSYTLRDTDTDEELPVGFRHWDLVPVDTDQ